jgi:hypothetical protein
MLHPAAWISVALLVTLAVLTFVPTPYIYATQGGPFSTVVNVGAVVWVVVIAWILIERTIEPRTPTLVSTIYPITYLALSAVVAMRARHTSR